MTRRPRLAAIIAVVAAVATGAWLAAPSAATVPGTWRPASGPTTAGDVLVDVAAVGPSSAWAVGVGYTSSDASAATSPVIEHWNGTAWSDVSDVPAADSLTSVSATSNDDRYVAGTTDHVYGDTRVWHNTGSGWNPLTGRGLPQGFTAQVLAVPHHLWLVGGVDAGLPHAGALIATFHGGGSPRWSVQRLSKHGAFFDAAARTAKDAWLAGGTSELETNGEGHPLAAHWNGKTWRLVRVRGTGQLTGIAIDAKDDAAAVGWRLPPPKKGPNGQYQPPVKPISMRWNGDAWKAVVACKCAQTVLTGGTHRSYWSVGGGYGHLVGKHWHSTPVPDGAQVTALARVPGTRMTVSVGCHGSNFFSCYLADPTLTPAFQQEKS